MNNPTRMQPQLVVHATFALVDRQTLLMASIIDIPTQYDPSPISAITHGTYYVTLHLNQAGL